MSIKPKPEAVPMIDCTAAAEAFAAGGARFVDVREPDEWRSGHIPGAFHIPLGELGTRYLAIPSHERVIMVCRVGDRSYQATEYLLGHGHDQVANLDGGMLAWEEAGHPVG